MKNGFTKGFFAGMATVVILGGVFYLANTYVEPEAPAVISKSVSEKVDYLKQFIDMCYLEDTNEKDLENGIYKGMVDAIGDKYSAYYTKEEYEALMESQSGEYCGIGVGVMQEPDTGVINITLVYEGSPAEEAGIKAGDILYKVKGNEVTGEDLDAVVADIRGEEGTTIELTVYREQSNKYIDMDVSRRIIDVPTIDYEMVDVENKIGYIAIVQFDENTDEQFSEALADLKKQGMKSVIFDVRSNPGGLYTTVCNMLDEILPEGTLVYTMDKYEMKEEQTSDAECLDMPMAVLINGDSASASEIFAGAIQDFDAGEIVGTQSFGKGIVQSIYPLDDGSAIKLTMAKYYTPNGVNIHGKGITPDVEVELPADAKTDTQLEKAIEILNEK